MGTTRRCSLVCVLAAGLVLTAVGCGGDGDGNGDLTPLEQHWSGFRGTDGQAVSDETSVPTTWDASTSQNIKWKVSVPLPGVSSPIVCGDLVFVTGADDTTREVYCYDATTGSRLWRKSVVAPGTARDQFDEGYEGLGYAAPTVASDGVHVCAIFGNGDLACFDYEGTEKWVLNVGPDGATHGPDIGYAHSSSLVVHKGLLIVQLDQGWEGENKSELMALDVASGRVVWQRKGSLRPVRQSWATPMVVNAAGKDQLITCADPWVISYDPATGAEIWKSECVMGDVVASPVYVPTVTGYPDGLVIVVDEMGTKAISPDATGEVIVPDGLAWQNSDASTCVPSLLAHGGLVFVVTDYGWLRCLDATDGTMAWPSEQDLTGSGAYYYPSPILAGGNVYLLRRDGVTVIFKAQASAYQEVARPQLGAADVCDASLAFVNGCIYVRTNEDTNPPRLEWASWLYCIGQ